MLTSVGVGEHPYTFYNTILMRHNSWRWLQSPAIAKDSLKQLDSSWRHRRCASSPALRQSGQLIFWDRIRRYIVSIWTYFREDAARWPES
mmetsp:Transcript_12327/g.17655  ORF Transcript_12327/g.17655 Transcript_12327/m.17655 type:complete len:90 (+) Transcript_12327:315-584(+)